MEPMTAFLLSMQAAGLVTSLFGKQSQQKLIQQGRKLEQEQLSTNLQALRLESAESSLSELKQVRQNIGSQIVASSARGNRAGAALGVQKTIGNFNSDERKRRINLLAKESQLRASDVLSGLHTLQSESELGQSLTKDFLNTVPIAAGMDSLLNSGKKKASTNANSNTGGEFSWGY